MSLIPKKNKLHKEIENLKAKLEKAELELEAIKGTKKSTSINTADTNPAKEFDDSENDPNINQFAIRDLVETMVQGFSLHKMIYKDGKPVDYEFILINESFEKLTGLKRENTIGKSVLEILPNTEKIWIDNYAKVSETGESLHFENFSSELNKTYNVVSYSPQKGYFATIFSDVTNEKQIEKDLLEAKNAAEESSKLKTMFLNNMSHEIRTPLNVIIGFTKLLNTKREISEKQRNEYNKMIIEGGDQLIKVIEDILEISSITAQQTNAAFEPFSINELLDELKDYYKFQSEEKKLPIHFANTLEDEESYIVSDRSKLYKILRNIICNALKYTSEGQIDVTYEVKDNSLEFKVKDTGIGIENEDQKFIFKRFSQEDNEVNKFKGGLGIGLAIAKENLKILKGEISYNSNLNGGTTFTLNIPYFKKVLHKKVKIEKIEKEELKDKKEYTLLIAEDEDLNFKFLDIMLQKNDFAYFKTLRAHNGKEVIEICDSNRHIDLILMDIQMPVLDGNKATQIIKEKYPTLPIIAQTAYSGINDMEKAKQHGCDDFIAKPLDADLLFNKIFDLLKIK